MGRASCFHCRYVLVHSNIFDVSGDQFPCTGMGSIIIHRLVIVSFFSGAVYPPADAFSMLLLLSLIFNILNVTWHHQVSFIFSLTLRLLILVLLERQMDFLKQPWLFLGP